MTDDRAQILIDLSDALSRLLTASLVDMRGEHEAQLAHLLEHDLGGLRLTVDMEPFRVLVSHVKPDGSTQDLFCVAAESPLQSHEKDPTCQ